MKKLVLKKGDAISRGAADCLLKVFTRNENKSERVRPISKDIKTLNVECATWFVA